MRADKLRVERAAVAATELSLTRCAELFMAVPVVDHGVDLMACQVSAASLFGDVATALREHSSPTFDEHHCYFGRPA